MGYSELVGRLRDIIREQEALELVPRWPEDCYLEYGRLMAEREDIDAILLEMERVNP